MEMLKNGWTLASGCADGSIHMYDLRSMDGPYMSAKAHDTSVFCIKFISHVPTSSASSTSSSNKENMKYLASTMNGSSNSSSQSSSEHSMKRSNSYNNQELANIANCKHQNPCLVQRLEFTLCFSSFVLSVNSLKFLLF
jgi:WD40 repeat protein